MIFPVGSFISATTGATGGGAGCSYANSGGLGGAATDGRESLFAACTTPNQCNALSAPITSIAPSNIQTNGEVRRGVGCETAALEGGVAAAVVARGTPVEVCVKFVVVVPSMRGGGITGRAARKSVSRSAMD